MSSADSTSLAKKAGVSNNLELGVSEFGKVEVYTHAARDNTFHDGRAKRGSESVDTMICRRASRASTSFCRISMSGCVKSEKEPTITSYSEVEPVIRSYCRCAPSTTASTPNIAITTGIEW